MRSGVRLLGAGVFVLGVSGCPVTDDYFIEAGRATGGVESAGRSGAGTFSAGSSSGGVSQGATGGVLGTAGSASVAGGGVIVSPAAGASAAGQAGGGGAPPAACVPTTERCNGHDDNCDEVADELACNSALNGTTGCAGFVLSSRPNHGYMLCTTNHKDWTDASDACVAQDMRLAWLESSAENIEVSKKVDALSTETDVLFGANDIAVEGKWVWDGGLQFWQGDGNGRAVNGMFNAWSNGIPNDANDGEDCAVLHPTTADWGDRTCFATYAYLCEEHE